MNIVLLLSKKDGKLVKDGMMLKDGTEDGTAKTGVVKNQDGRCLVPTHAIAQISPRDQRS